jgi:hypothetical protein
MFQSEGRAVPCNPAERAVPVVPGVVLEYISALPVLDPIKIPAGIKVPSVYPIEPAARAFPPSPPKELYGKFLIETDPLPEIAPLTMIAIEQ